MSSRPLALCLLLLAALPACAPLPPPKPFEPPGPGELWPGQRQARFDSDPAGFFSAAAAACAGPGRRVIRSGSDTVSCEMLPTPEAAAALILRYGGTLEALPTYVISFSTRREGAGYIVTADARTLVPRPDGVVLTLRFADPALDVAMRDLLAAAGGQTL